jgi:hypothetical protein
MVFLVTSTNIYSQTQQKLITMGTLIGLESFFRKQTKARIIYIFVFFVFIRNPCTVKRLLFILFIVSCVIFIMACGRGWYI